jgi:hypothetical protein
MADDRLVRVEREQAAPGEAGAVALPLLCGLLDSFLDSYLVAARALEAVAQASEKDATKAALARAERMYLQGEIQRREAVAKTSLQNAIRYFRELGVRDVEAARAAAEGVQFFRNR